MKLRTIRPLKYLLLRSYRERDRESRFGVGFVPAFTLVELIIVIVVIAILAAITIVAYNGIQQRAVIATLQSDLDGASKQLTSDYYTNSTYPTTIAAANGGLGLKASNGNTYVSYTVNNLVTPPSFCLVENNVSSGLNYSVSSSNSIPSLASSGGCYITNMVTNPSFEANTTGWYTANSSSFVRATTYQVNSGSYGIRVTAGNTTSDTGIGMTMPSLVAGTPYTFSAFIRPVTTGAYSLSVQGTAGDTSRTTQTLTAGVVTRLSETWTPSSSGTGFLYVLRQGIVPANTNQFDVDGVMLTTGSTLYNYADGDTTGWNWTGTAENSTSTGGPV